LSWHGVELESTTGLPVVHRLRTVKPDEERTRYHRSRNSLRAFASIGGTASSSNGWGDGHGRRGGGNSGRWLEAFSTRLIMALSPAGIILWVLCATVGMLALWVAVLSRREVDHRPRARAVLIICLICGSVAAMLWLYVMGRTTHDVKAWAIWLGFLGGPLIVTTRHLIVLVRDWRSQLRDPADAPPKIFEGCLNQERRDYFEDL
jgi:hypothetical protein